MTVPADKKAKGHILESEKGPSSPRDRGDGGCLRMEGWPSRWKMKLLWSSRLLARLAENKDKPQVSCGVRRQSLQQVPPLKATRCKVKYSPFQLSRT